ncbi:hypothetical protein FOA52_008285 [Chlamydomonas sp. UWO 241]|nr:hypothetical protein FOA52_008285 [Chlamydomonas sp. UWO 241]
MRATILAHVCLSLSLLLLLLSCLRPAFCVVQANAEQTASDARAPPGPSIRGFSLGDVRLSQDTFQSRAMRSNADYLLSPGLAPDRLLYAFRANAKLPTPGVPFIGTWEDPHCELRGHFVGHYLTALAYMAVGTEAKQLKKAKHAAAAPAAPTQAPEHPPHEDIPPATPTATPAADGPTIDATPIATSVKKKPPSSEAQKSWIKTFPFIFIATAVNLATNGSGGIVAAAHAGARAHVEVLKGLLPTLLMGALWICTELLPGLKFASLLVALKAGNTSINAKYNNRKDCPDEVSARSKTWEKARLVLSKEGLEDVDPAVAFDVEGNIVEEEDADNETAHARLSYLVDELFTVQEALGEGGYLSAFPSEHFDRVEALEGVWAPYYVIHKIMAGLLDAHVLCGNARALTVVVAMADYHLRRFDAVVAAHGDQYWQRVLECEFGGMNDVMYRLYSVTRDAGHLRLARAFDKTAFLQPLTQGRDVLAGHHANTHLAQPVFPVANLQPKKTHFRVEIGRFGWRVGLRLREFRPERCGKQHVHTFLHKACLPSGCDWAVSREARVETLFPQDFLAEPLAPVSVSVPNTLRALKPSGTDVLAGHHANTHLAQVVGYAERSEATGDVSAAKAVQAFFAMVTGPHAYATGGSNDKEFWFEPGMLGESVTNHDDAIETHETCTQYNILKIARSVFTWTGDVRVADFYERALVNGILGVSRLTNADVAAGHGHKHNEEHAGHALHKHQLTGQGVGSVPLSRSSLPHHHFMHGANTNAEGEDRSEAAAGAAGAGVAPTANASVPLHRRSFVTKFFDYWGMNLAKMPGNDTATNVPGTPGVFLYLLPMGSGQSKGDNLHHWGYPEHSFWCCYGAAVESFAKLADSIYFSGAPGTPGGPPTLYVNQYVSSSLAWRDQGVAVGIVADMFADGPSVTARLAFDMAASAGGSGGGGGDRHTSASPSSHFTLALRIPQWADVSRTAVFVNGAPWGAGCPGAPTAGTYCAITREWASGDIVSLLVGMGYWVRGLPDSRPEYASLTALMMGPYVMAGVTHDTRWLELDITSSAALASAFEEPDDEDGLVSMQAAWNASLFVRHDAYHAHMSEMEDNGDAGDATFRIVRGCHHSRAGDGRAGGGGGGGDGGGVGEQLHHMHHQMKVGMHDNDAVMLESMNFPGFYLGVDGPTDVALTLTQPGVRGGDSKAYCSGHQFMLRSGLDGTPDTITLESVAHPGSVVSAAVRSDPPACADDAMMGCGDAANKGWCVAKPDIYRVHCRVSCNTCAAAASALSLQPISVLQGDPAAAAVSSFRFAHPLQAGYPPGSKVVTGENRRYLVAPLGNLVDERYSVYFDIRPPTSATQ